MKLYSSFLILIAAVLISSCTTVKRDIVHVVEEKQVFSPAGDYHEEISKLAAIYNGTKGFIPKSQIFYSIIDDLIKANKECPFNAQNFVLSSAVLSLPITPAMSDGKNWQIQRKWSELWAIQICESSYIKEIMVDLTPYKAAKWQIHDRLLNF